MPTELTVQSILALSNAFPEEREWRFRQIKKPTDSKIKTLVQQQIAQAIEGKSGALFPSATAPRVVIGILSSLRVPKKKREERIQLMPAKQRLPPPAPVKRIPIGLHRSEPFNWMSGLIQFLLFLPGSWELFSLIPRSFQPLREFADQYWTDQEENRPVSSADSTELIRCLIRKLSPHFLEGKPILYEILRGWMKAMFSHCPFELPGEIHPVVLHPEWHAVRHFRTEAPHSDQSDQKEFEEAFQKKITENPPEILVGIKGAPCPLKGHYFASSQAGSYELDSFVELRPDGENGEHYIAYLKRDGTWYQCDEERVIRFRSNCLNVPLRQANLLHYKKIALAGR